MKKNKKLKIIKNKKTLILIIAIVLLLFIIAIINKKDENKNVSEEINYNELTTVENVVRYFNSTYIKHEKSKSEDYYFDIYIGFKYDLYENGANNKLYYEGLLQELTNLLKTSYRVFDETKNIQIDVKYFKDTNQFYYTVNGEENYFQKQDSKNSMVEYEKDPIKDLQINSDILMQLNENNWKSSKISLGTKDSIYNKYDIYFDEGIMVKNINENVYNIIFTQRYTNSVINGIVPGKSLEEIASILGTQTYGETYGPYIGYKGDDIYVFFTKEGEISVYRNLKDFEDEEFEKLLVKYVEKEIDLKEFMNELTYLWPDYDEYEYDSNRIYMTYPNKGIEIDMTSDNSIGIKIYKNCNITNKINELIKNGKITCELKTDLIDKIMNNKIIKDMDRRYIADLNSNKVSNLYNFCQEEKNVYFISIDRNNPDKMLNEQITSGIFIDDINFIYSIESKGIYVFNLLNNKKTDLITGEEKFEIKEYTNGILKYDEKEIQIIME